MPMQVNRVIGHGQIADADAHLVVQSHVQAVDTRKDTAVPRPQVLIEHGHDLGRIAAGVNVIGVEQEAKITLHVVNQWMFGLGVCDPKTHHAHGHLCHFVGVRVVHERAGAACHELVHKGLTGLNGGLIEPRHAVHTIGADADHANAHWCAPATCW